MVMLLMTASQRLRGDAELAPIAEGVQLPANGGEVGEGGG